MIHIWRPWKLSNFQDPKPPLSIYVQNSFTSFTLDVQFQATSPPPLLPMITNKLKENTFQGWLLYVIPSLRSPFLFIINSLILFDFPLTSFHLAETSLLFDLAHRKCNGIRKGWLHCLTSEWKGRFLVNSILMFGSA